MICTVTGRDSCGCTPSLSMYNYGCRCDGARAAMRDYKRNYRARNRAKAVCPLCASETSRASGFCRECEGRL